MVIYEYKIQGKKQQTATIERAIQITQFIQTRCLRLWIDTPEIRKNDLQCYCTVLAKEDDFAICLNSQARQTAADRA